MIDISDWILYTRLIIFKLKLENINLELKKVKNILGKILIPVSKSLMANLKGKKSS